MGDDARECDAKHGACRRLRYVLGGEMAGAPDDGSKGEEGEGAEGLCYCAGAPSRGIRRGHRLQHAYLTVGPAHTYIRSSLRHFCGGESPYAMHSWPRVDVFGGL